MDTNPKATTPLSIEQAKSLLIKHEIGETCENLLVLGPILNDRNTTYLITSNTGKEYIIRFSQSWASKTINEVATIKYLAQNISIPVPKVVGYCSNASDSVTGYEYILMEKLKGVPLGEIFRDLTLSRKLQVLDNVVKILKEYQSIKFDQIGSFVLDTNSPSGVSLGSLMRTPDETKPFNTYLEYLKAIYKTELNTLTQSSHLMDDETPSLIKRIENFIQKVCNIETTPLTREIIDVPFVFTHKDFHSYNILVDESTLEITGVLDFEFSGSFPIDDEWYKCCSFIGVKDFASSYFKDGLKTMSDSEKLECSDPAELESIRHHFFQSCKDHGVKTPQDIDGHEERSLLHYFGKYIAPWWIRESTDNTKTFDRDLKTTRERLRSVLDIYD